MCLILKLFLLSKCPKNKIAWIRDRKCEFPCYIRENTSVSFEKHVLTITFAKKGYSILLFFDKCRFSVLKHSIRGGTEILTCCRQTIKCCCLHNCKNYCKNENSRGGGETGGGRRKKKIQGIGNRRRKKERNKQRCKERKKEKKESQGLEFTMIIILQGKEVRHSLANCQDNVLGTPLMLHNNKSS